MTDPSVTITTGVRSYRRAALAFGLLILLPIALSLINVTFAQSWKVHFFPAVLLAYACQLPWLIVSGYFFVGFSAEFIARLVVVLFLGNLLWALLIALAMKPIKKYLC